MRTLSATALEAMLKQQTKEVFLLCLEITHPNLSPPIRVVRGIKNALVHGGNTYTAYPFDINLPGESGDELAKVTLRIDNVSREIVEAVRNLSSPATVSLFVVLASSPDIIEAGPFEMTLRDTTYDALTVEGELRWEDILNQSYPGHLFTPATCPGLF
ncbi:MAG: DUF1833 family protein [Thermodesulfobacteriota bacterium]